MSLDSETSGVFGIVKSNDHVPCKNESVERKMGEDAASIRLASVCNQPSQTLSILKRCHRVPDDRPVHLKDLNTARYRPLCNGGAEVFSVFQRRRGNRALSVAMQGKLNPRITWEHGGQQGDFTCYEYCPEYLLKAKV